VEIQPKMCRRLLNARGERENASSNPTARHGARLQPWIHSKRSSRATCREFIQFANPGGVGVAESNLMPRVTSARDEGNMPNEISDLSNGGAIAGAHV